MIRIETEDGWWLVNHQDHARLAAAFGHYWNTPAFPAPEPRRELLTAVTHHDDAWVARDSKPELTRAGKPSAFTKELVGAYTAFEEIDFYDYLKVRGNATEAQAADHPYSAMLISMHTVSLLTKGADLNTLSEEEKDFFWKFIEGQKARQLELLADAIAKNPSLEAYSSEEARQRCFEFVQACDSLSLTVCVGYETALPLQHKHPTADGERVEIMVEPLGENTYRLSPNPLNSPEVTLTVPARFVPGKEFASLEAYREAFFAAEVQEFKIKLVS